MKHIMIDIETLGHSVNSVICQIAAVGFNYESEDRLDFCCNVLPESCVSYGMQTDISTIKWWMSQTKEAQQNVFNPKEAIDLKSALHELIGFFHRIGEEHVQVWANSPSFDLSILRYAYNRVGYPCPWKYWQERDVRTMESLVANLKKKIPPPQNAHDGLVDCHYQIDLITHVCLSLEIIKPKAS